MAQIFISYRRGPTGYVATLLADVLKTHFGQNAVFMDIDNIPLGVDFRDHIGAAVSECQVLLALIGDDWLASKLPDGTRRIDAAGDFVRVEIESALQRGIPVVPILANAATVPRESELPESLRPLAFRNAAELRSGSDLKGQMQHLVRQLSLICAAKNDSPTDGIPPAPTPARSLPSAKNRRRVMVVSAGAISLLLIALLSVMFWTRNKSSSAKASVRDVIVQTDAGAPLILYTGPDRHSATCGFLRRGSNVVIESTSEGTDGQMWSKISVAPGWLAARNLAQPDVAMLRSVYTDTLQVGQMALVTYTGPDGLNLRESPSQQSKVIAYVLANTQVIITNDKLTTPEHEWWGAEIPPAYVPRDALK